MNTCTLKENLVFNLTNKYVSLLLKAQTLHSKLEHLFIKLQTKKNLKIKNQILKINNILNSLFIQILNCQKLLLN